MHPNPAEVQASTLRLGTEIKASNHTSLGTKVKASNHTLVLVMYRLSISVLCCLLSFMPIVYRQIAN